MHLRTVELFAGVGGFRLGLERAGGYDVVWWNQWEPRSKRNQYAFDAYVANFHAGEEVDPVHNTDITEVPAEAVPEHDLLVGGFPCQDYSVQTTLDKSMGMLGKKGVLWWEIARVLEHRRPPYVLLENVDRLLRSPAKQRGRDFGVMLACLAHLGYRVEWRVLNAADYGFPQRRRRTFVFAAHSGTDLGAWMAASAAGSGFLERDGFFAGEFPVLGAAGEVEGPQPPDVVLDGDVKQVSDAFAFDFQNAGVMVDSQVWSRRVEPAAEPAVTLGAVVRPGAPEVYCIAEERMEQWAYQKGAKDEKRTAKNGHEYRYKEGPVAFPDPLERPSRTMLTTEGNRSPNRTTHIIRDPGSGRLRRLTPEECEALNGFPAGWTATMPERWRCFAMGNALVVGLVERMGRRLRALLEAPPETVASPVAEPAERVPMAPEAALAAEPRRHVQATLVDVLGR